MSQSIMTCGHSSDHLSMAGMYCVLCATDPKLQSFMVNHEPGAKLTTDLYDAGHALIAKLRAQRKAHLVYAEMYANGERGVGRMSEASCQDMAVWNNQEAEKIASEIDYLAQALGYEVLPLPAMPRYQHPDGRKLYL